MAKPTKPKAYPGDSQLDPNYGNPFTDSKSNSQLLREAKKKGPAAIEAYYNKLASARRVDAGKRAKEVTDDYNLRRSLITNSSSPETDYRLARESNILSRSRLGTGATPKGEFLVGPLGTDAQRNLGRAKNAKMKAIQAAKAKAGKKK